MAVTNAMFIFEVVVESVRSLVESRLLVIRSDFADIFSLELKDPKQMQIVIPDPPPLPPAPAGKKKKQKKPKPKKGKKGKKGKIVLPPPEPAIQSGQSVLFTSSAEFLIQNMKKFPLEVSLWSKEDNFTYIGSTLVPWDPMFLTYLELIYNAQEPQPVTLKEEYNIFEEGTAKLMAKLGIQVKLSYLGERVTTAFRTLSEDPTVKKFLYTGINSKTTSYMCTMKTTDEDFEENCNKIENNYVVDKPENKIVYADYKNAAAANLTFFSDGDYCCMGHADKPPESMYKAPETCPDVDFIVDYVRKIIVSCNDNMRMLTPRPTITPRVKATDMDRLCYCKETSWPDGKFAQQFRKEAQTEPCPVCINAGKVVPGSRGAKFDIANLRGPCGKPDCRIARDLRAYIENLVEEDDKEFDVNGIIGPCGSKTCTLAEKIQEFIRHEGVFKKGVTLEGLPTQCACVQKMEQALQKKTSCDSFCSKDCDETGSEASDCQGKGCPFKKPDQQVYSVYYFTVEHDFDKNTPGTSSPNKENSFKYCSCDCPSVKNSEVTTSSKSVCSTKGDKTNDSSGGSKYQLPVCPSQQENFLPSPADSNVVLKFSDIHNPCCVKTCDVVEKVKDFIVDGLESKKKKNKNKKDGEDCYCDCVCSFKFTKNTTYCAVCGGYECMGDDMKDQPDYAKPHPCPVYHKLYDKKYIETPNPWPEDVTNKKPLQADQKKGSKSPASKSGSSKLTISRTRSMKSVADRKSEKKDVEKKTEVKKEKKQVGKFTASVEKEPPPPVEKKPETKYPYPPVPKNMGWNWTAEDIPGMKPRPLWRPGAANKILVRRYRALREGVEGAKKKRGLMQRKKKPDNKPTLIVKKKDGEYIVQMEVFKKYSKDRLLFQNPYEDKPPLIYSIGKTAEEKANIQKQRDRRERRETRRKSRLLQSTFRDKCQEICLKAYNQAIGILPLPNPNDPECPCYTQTPQNVTPPIDSCSCSDVGTISSSDTDRDEWEIQFSPPAALYNAKAKHPPIPVENETQYTYLDYKVKLLDKRGNQVPRYFTGPEGKQECSDLGGFWSPNHEWQEINKDGYIGPDNRWVPMNFIGPDGMSYSAEEGSFTDSHGQLLKIGIDGYIDKAGKWAWYARRARGGTKSAKSGFVSSVKSGKDGKPEPASKGRGDAKGKDSPQPPLDKGKKPGGVGDKLLKSVSPSSPKAKKPLIMSVSVNYDRSMLPRLPNEDRLMVDPKKMAMYKEVMQYDDIYELKPPVKMNRASNTSRNKQNKCSNHTGGLTPSSSSKFNKFGEQSSRNTNTEQQSQARHTGITGVVSATTDNQRSSKISKLVQGHAKTNKQQQQEAGHTKGTAKMTTGYIPNSCDVQKFQGKSWTDSRPVTCRPEPVDCCSKLVECSPKPIECRPKPDSHRMSKFRPLWRPGATNKHVVRLLRMAKNPGEVFHKKKKKVTGSKKPLKRPLLVVQKKDGEYTVTMETMKTYQKPRTVNQNPYEDKPVHTYTIGRTEEENCERRKKKERKNRRLEREQRNFVESAFRDICNEICLKTYQQALGILPGAEDPDCPCYPAQPGADKTNLDLSCSCSEDKSYISSDTDCDEWVVEFTPPSATFDQAFKSKKVVKVDNTSQYTYLDYQVKLFDAYGKPIPRFFKGADGRIQCSDLGGFWSPEHKWLEINNDGYIAPDGRWAPMNFIGPGGDKIDGQSGKFQGVNAEWLDVGIDGFVDCHGRWKFYPKPRRISPQNKKPRRDTSKKGAREKKNDKVPYQHSQVSWSCFGDVSPKQLSKIGIVGHGHDRKTLMAVLQKMLAQGEDVKIPRPSTVPRMPTPKKGKRRRARAIEELLMERIKCRHRVPSDKGILAVDEYGNKTYFKKKRCKSKRQKQRMVNLAHQGISLSSFHVPCFNSSLNAEMMKQHQYQSEIVKKKYVSISTQAR